MREPGRAQRRETRSRACARVVGHVWPLLWARGVRGGLVWPLGYRTWVAYGRVLKETWIRHHLGLDFLLWRGMLRALGLFLLSFGGSVMAGTLKSSTVLHLALDGEPVQVLTWGEFLTSNTEGVDLLAVSRGLRGSDEFEGGGGPSPSWLLSVPEGSWSVVVRVGGRQIGDEGYESESERDMIAERYAAQLIAHVQGGAPWVVEVVGPGDAISRAVYTDENPDGVVSP